MAGGEGEAAPHDEHVVFLLRKDVPGLGLAGDLLADHEAAHRGGQHGLERVTLRLGNQQLGETLDGIHALADLGALEIVAAVQAGAQDKVPLQQGAGPGEDVENFRLFGGHGFTLQGTCRKNKNILHGATRPPMVRTPC